MKILIYIILFFAIYFTFATLRTSKYIKELDIDSLTMAIAEIVTSLLWIAYFILSNNIK